MFVCIILWDGVNIGPKDQALKFCIILVWCHKLDNTVYSSPYPIFTTGHKQLATLRCDVLYGCSLSEQATNSKFSNKETLMINLNFNDFGDKMYWLNEIKSRAHMGDKTMDCFQKFLALKGHSKSCTSRLKWLNDKYNFYTRCDPF